MEGIIKRIAEQGVLPLYFHPDATVSVEVLKALYAAGIRAVEYTNRGEAALDNFKLLKETRDKELPELLLGIGTIKRKKEAKAFIKAGADFIIAPGIIEEVAETVHKEEMVWIPGCMTTTEIIRAEDAGAKLIKLFPGNLLGPAFVSAIKELFPDLLFMPTGGVEVNKENLTGWFKAGVAAVGMGSKLITKEILEKKDYEQLINKTKEAIALVNEVRNVNN
ncbi:bifunctional 4-hydroxy-2-oxoglutarate aldolase/2-dehydro-3-deoxy-phosphogluconate aldolase [Pseudoflavitalea sp. X16]|uniref:bifunctional 4-hydroxy-2-oxoglutarate aldolase/2-dehydro-3-deoxy-phosphogluconate aldolase n=1 Tax=Paraflavitalea devenefica TaxID=2716334 RepID=UPI0014235BA9|nr:bifunctional 4-hydroxy-2-oxoglutarate aldolase/2-dehydro-3-deoxy-phosphogluconate aldolase [Paraflavitalea devenefica]NII27306.1 bifunctional 4-hydroxy-2-oxoglutarate aldolase/2-dehydro-3-deoxy-phosphogluconate aldolase [Paraflavitalea devenefica]